MECTDPHTGLLRRSDHYHDKGEKEEKATIPKKLRITASEWRRKGVMKFHENPGGGDCLWWALAQATGLPRHYIKQKAISRLRAAAHQSSMPGIKTQAREMAKPAQWADTHAMAAAAAVLRCQIVLHADVGAWSLQPATTERRRIHIHHCDHHLQYVQMQPLQEEGSWRRGTQQPISLRGAGHRDNGGSGLIDYNDAVSECYSEVGPDGRDICGESDTDEIIEREQYYRDIEQHANCQRQTVQIQPTVATTPTTTTTTPTMPVTTTDNQRSDEQGLRTTHACRSGGQRLSRSRTRSPPRYHTGARDGMCQNDRACPGHRGHTSGNPTRVPTTEDHHEPADARRGGQVPWQLHGGGRTVSTTEMVDSSPYGSATPQSREGPPSPRPQPQQPERQPQRIWRRPLRPAPSSPLNLETVRVREWQEQHEIDGAPPAAQPCMHKLKVISAATTVMEISLPDDLTVDMLKRSIAKRHGVHYDQLRLEPSPDTISPTVWCAQYDRLYLTTVPRHRNGSFCQMLRALRLERLLQTIRNEEIEQQQLRIQRRRDQESPTAIGEGEPMQQEEEQLPEPAPQQQQQLRPDAEDDLPESFYREHVQGCLKCHPRGRKEYPMWVPKAEQMTWVRSEFARISKRSFQGFYLTDNNNVELADLFECAQLQDGATIRVHARRPGPEPADPPAEAADPDAAQQPPMIAGGASEKAPWACPARGPQLERQCQDRAHAPVQVQTPEALPPQEDIESTTQQALPPRLTGGAKEEAPPLPACYGDALMRYRRLPASYRHFSNLQLKAMLRAVPGFSKKLAQCQDDHTAAQHLAGQAKKLGIQPADHLEEQPSSPPLAAERRACSVHFDHGGRDKEVRHERRPRSSTPKGEGAAARVRSPVRWGWPRMNSTGTPTSILSSTSSSSAQECIWSLIEQDWSLPTCKKLSGRPGWRSLYAKPDGS